MNFLHEKKTHSILKKIDMLIYIKIFFSNISFTNRSSSHTSWYIEYESEWQTFALTDNQFRNYLWAYEIYYKFINISIQ